MDPIAGYVSVINDTPWDWHLSEGLRKYQMGGWEWPQTIAAGATYWTRAIFERNPFKTWSDDSADVRYQFSTGTRIFKFQLKARSGSDPDHYIEVTYMTDFRDIPAGSTIQLGSISTTISEDVEFNPKSDLHSANLVITGSDPSEGPWVTTDNYQSWIQRSMATLQNLTPSQLCLPFSHDSGMYRVDNRTIFVSTDNTRTQELDIGDQLMIGCRYFDLRPCLLDKVQAFVAVHGSWIDGIRSNVTWLGGTGITFTQVIKELNAFTSTHRELIVIELSHGMRLGSQWSDLDPAGWNHLLTYLSGAVQNLYICPDPKADLTRIPLKELCWDKSAVIFTVSDNVLLGDLQGKGFYYGGGMDEKFMKDFNLRAQMYYTGGYSNSSIVKTIGTKQAANLMTNRTSSNGKPFLLEWTYSLSIADDITSSIQEGTKQVHGSLNRTLMDLCKRERYPNMIGTDFIAMTRPTPLALAVNNRFAQYAPYSFDSEVVGALYWTKDVTSLVQNNYNRGKKDGVFEQPVNNTAMGGDPDEGVVKTLYILLRKWDRVNPCISYCTVFSAQEGSTVRLDPREISAANSKLYNDFTELEGGTGWKYEVVSAAYVTVDPTTSINPKIVTDNVRTQYGQYKTFPVSNELLGGDPANGKWKRLEVLMRRYHPVNMTSTSTYRLYTQVENQVIDLTW